MGNPGFGASTRYRPCVTVSIDRSTKPIRSILSWIKTRTHPTSGGVITIATARYPIRHLFAQKTFVFEQIGGRTWEPTFHRGFAQLMKPPLIQLYNLSGILKREVV